MGKGGTKFCGDAVGVRLKSVGYTLKDAKKVSSLCMPRMLAWDEVLGGIGVVPCSLTEHATRQGQPSLIP